MNINLKVLISIVFFLQAMRNLEKCRIFARQIKAFFAFVKYRNEQKSARFHIVIYIE